MVEFFKQFLSYYKNYVKEFIYVIIGSILTAAGTAGSAYVIKPVLDEIFIKKDVDMLYILPYAVVALYAAKGIGRYMQAYYSSYIGLDIIRELRDRILHNLLSLDISFFHEFRSGEMISRLINDVERIRSAVSNFIPVFIREVMTIIALLFVVIYQNPLMAFYSLVVLPLGLAPLIILARKVKKFSKKSQEKNSDITSILTEIFNNIEIIKANTTERLEVDNFKKANKQFFDINMNMIKSNELVSPVMETLGSVAVVLVIILGGKDVIDGNMSVGSFFSFVTALFMLYTPIKRVSEIHNRMQDALAASERIFHLLSLKPSIKSGKITIKNGIERVEFKDVYLRYGNKEALRGVSFGVERNETIALVGDSGSGKSSIVNLVLRFYEVNKGAVLLDGVDIKEYDIKSLRDSISIVTQRVYIFNDTVARNVAYGLEYDEGRVIEALKSAYAYDFVNMLENGIHTKLQEFGANLSGGQRQRIAIARAFYKNPKILIFDEATSALDEQSQFEITKALRVLEKSRITFIIAHRISTIEHANKIVVLKNGKILDMGSDIELGKRCEEYKKLKYKAT
jgi:subfamily B ATP-binding cassette protein MsbA